MKLHISKSDVVELEELTDVGGRSRHGRQFSVSVGEDSARLSGLINTAVQTHFEMPDSSRLSEGGREAIAAADKIRPAMFREQDSQLLRVVYKELVVEFTNTSKSAIRKSIFEKYGLKVRRKSNFDPNRYVVYDPRRNIIAQKVVEISNELMQLDEVDTASPNFVSEFPREAAPSPSSFQWHLNHRLGQDHDPESDVEIRGAWENSQGAPHVVVAVLDDGVDVEHPNLRDNIVSLPDPNEPRDVVGRDFYIDDEEDPEHFNPRPKLFRHPYNRMAGNDIHGTPCAGVVASTGRLSKIYGAAPKCKILPVKVFHADELASESRVADAITYAALYADILSCSWSGPRSSIIDAALAQAESGAAGFRRGKLGTPVFFATGNNGFNNSVSYPAASDSTIGVGATTDQATVASYSNKGPEVWVSAPSSGGVRGIMTTDVSYPNRGFNLGVHADGGKDGFHTNDFGGTSSATPLVAGIAALILSAAPHLTLDAVKEVLSSTADRIGTGYTGTPPHSPAYGHGRVNAAAAVLAALKA
ncbi:S8 family serine peptidase [Leisingera caerulea]|uniref:S8 family serine peptidase n=1 Tax=Leisingera caerulea TaxID=506591 RepID=UPI0021A79B85|nr:S8 family serine peptidase [Leisingera caerulea]UWQ84380.1 S8 family serine peptidase [Leisingera caerulea]